VRIAGSSLLYSRHSLDDACHRLSALGFDAVDVALQEGWAHVDPSSVVGAVDETADDIEAACQSAGLDPVALNVNAGDVPLATELDRVEATIELAAALGIGVVTLPAADADASLSDDLSRFRTLVDCTAGTDVTLTVETHWGTLTEDPVTAAKYAGEVPGLGYTLDPGHFVVGDHPTDDPWRELLDDVAHVHVRQAGSGWDEIQLPPDAGDLDVASFVRSLRHSGYDGVLTVEYIDSLDGIDPDEAERQADGMRARLAQVLA